jgi:hypothetical protein
LHWESPLLWYRDWQWQWYESTPVADIAVNRHQSGISILES